MHPHKISRFTKQWCKSPDAKYPTITSCTQKLNKIGPFLDIYFIKYYSWKNDPYAVYYMKCVRYKRKAIELGSFHTMYQAKQACKKHLLK